MSSHLLRLLLFLCFPVSIFADDDAAKAKATDADHLKKIHAALVAFKKAKGEFPAHLHELIPEFLPEPALLVSPLGADADPAAEKRAYDPKLPCSYRYEFSTAQYPESQLSWRALKSMQLEEFGPVVPILRCFGHGPVLNISHAGDVFETDEQWEWHAETQRLMEKHDAGPGLKTGKKLVVSLVDEAGQPVRGVSLKAYERSSNVAPIGLFPIRDFSADEQGKVTIPLGTDPKAHVLLGGFFADWCQFYRAWNFGDEGTPEKGEVATITITLKAAAPMGGTVRDAKGTPVAGAELTAYTNAKDPEQREFLGGAKTDAEGRWTLKAMPKSGTGLILTVSKLEHRTLQLEPAAASEPSSSALLAQTAELRLQPPLRIEGTVTTAGQPVPGAKVFVSLQPSGAKKQAVADAQGHFTTTTEEPGKALVTVLAKDLAPGYQAAEIADEPKPLSIVLDAGRPLKGRVERAPGNPVAGVPITFNAFPASGMILAENPVIAVTDDRGFFTWEHAPSRVAWCSVLLTDGSPFSFQWDTAKNAEKVVRIVPGQ